MDCLQPAISRQLALLVNSITAERRQAVLEIARTSNNWHDFLDVLQRGGFPLPESVRRTRLRQPTTIDSPLEGRYICTGY